MAATLRSGGLQHAVSLGNIEISTQANLNISPRSYDSEDENMGRNRGFNQYSKAPIYSKGDIIEQYCLNDRQLSSIEPPRRDRFFGCWSGRGTPQSFLGVCVGRRAPSDENVADYAPIKRYPRFHQPTSKTYDDELDSSFRRKPTSFLHNSGDPKRYTWMPADEDVTRSEGPRTICTDMDDFNQGPFIVGSYPPSSTYLSQSQEHIAGYYRCPAHIGLPPPPPPPIRFTDAVQPRIKHVSFARSHTLTSFDLNEAKMHAKQHISATRSQERLIGGKKPTITVTHQQPFIQTMPMQNQPNLMNQQNLLSTISAQQEIVVIEKTKRNAMKTQATQTELYLARKQFSSHHLSLSPRTIHRVKMVSQGAQTNGGLNGRKLVKSLSEAGPKQLLASAENNIIPDEPKSPIDHEPVYRTQSEEPPKSPGYLSSATPSYKSPLPPNRESQSSRTPSRLSYIDTQQMDDSQTLTHSRNSSYQSQDSTVSFRSVDLLSSRASQESASYYQDLLTIQDQTIRRGSHTLSMEPYFDDRMIEQHQQMQQQHHHQMQQQQPQHFSNGYAYGMHSLPRKNCVHHQHEQFHTHSLPRRDHQHHHSHLHDTRHMSSYIPQEHHIVPRRFSYAIVTPEPQNFLIKPQQFYSHSPQKQDEELDKSDESCLSGESDDDTKEEQEIFIDFKPRISPVPSPKIISTKKKKLIKTLSEGEILIDKHLGHMNRFFVVASASEEDLKTAEKQRNLENLQYSDTPIQDEDICKPDLLELKHSKTNGCCKREAFRKRSVSLEDPSADAGDLQPIKKITFAKSAPPSPCLEELSVPTHSSFPSSDSLTQDGGKDHSDGIWNESQCTVLPGLISSTDKLHISPATKRKNLLLQHLQRSSLDTGSLDIEDIADQPLPPLPPVVSANQTQQPITTTTAQFFSSITSSTQTSSSTIESTTLTTSVSSTKPKQPNPSIAVTTSSSIELEEKTMHNQQTLNRRTKPISPSKRRELKKSFKKSHHEIEPVHLHKLSEVSEPSIPETFSNDISEASTTTEDYVTCTDNSKRTGNGAKGIRMAQRTPIRVQVSAQSSQAATQDGSSFESVSSLYSLTRGDAIDVPSAILIEEPRHLVKKKVSIPPSPVRTMSTSSSGSYCATKTSPTRHTKPKALQLKKTKPDAVSEGDKNQMPDSSSHDENEDRQMHSRWTRDITEEEKRRKKCGFKLELEKELALKSMTSPSLRHVTSIIKKTSPDAKSALNVLDGASPSKHKRFRPKTRKTPRNRSTSGDDALPRRIIPTPIIKSPEKCAIVAQKTVKLSPSKYHPTCRGTDEPTRKVVVCSDQRLQALSTESLRSVSPGSDSVFYSEADLMTDHQVHCHHCGKEVEIVTATGESVTDSTETIQPDIVQPPAGFADSPNGVKALHQHTRLYKKLEKRLRSEDRNTDKKYHRSRLDARAKSEERGKDNAVKSRLRPAGSSPCVAPLTAPPMDYQITEPEQGIYHGSYRKGAWICISDKDVWRRNELIKDVHQLERSRSMDERRGSTDSEKEFRKKYQAITHRLVHRKSCVEMYRRQNSNSFDSDKTVIVQRESGEFGFRIHGSKPVVVSAIEVNTPAETSGLEIGDIVLSVNGIPVIDKSHSEVVKIAHAGSDVLELEVARTIGVLSPKRDTVPSIYSGYLWKYSETELGSPKTKWIRRWFCLRADNCLYFYKSEFEMQPIGAVLLTSHRIEKGRTDTGRTNTFQIVSNEDVSLELSADTEEAVNRWTAIMSHASEQIDPWLEINTRYLTLAANSFVKPDCFGFLMKLGSRWRSWAKRYCVLKDACLFFYQDSLSKSAIGLACLQGYRIQPSAAINKKHAFELAPSEPKLRHFYFHTENEMDKKRWIAALEYSIDRWMKAS